MGRDRAAFRIEDVEPEYYDDDGDPVYHYEYYDDDDKYDESENDSNFSFIVDDQQQKYLLIKYYNDALDIPKTSFCIYGSLCLESNDLLTNNQVYKNNYNTLINYLIIDLNKLRSSFHNQSLNFIRLEENKINYQNIVPLILIQNRNIEDKLRNFGYIAISIQELISKEILVFSLNYLLEDEKHKQSILSKDRLVSNFLINLPTQELLELRIAKYLKRLGIMKIEFYKDEPIENYISNKTIFLNQIKSELINELGDLRQDSLINLKFQFDKNFYSNFLKSKIIDSFINNELVKILETSQYTIVQASVGKYEGKTLLLISKDRQSGIIHLPLFMVEHMIYRFVFKEYTDLYQDGKYVKRTYQSPKLTRNIWIIPSQIKQFASVVRIVYKRENLRISKYAPKEKFFLNEIKDFVLCLENEEQGKFVSWKNLETKGALEQYNQAFKNGDMIQTILLHLEQWKLEEFIDTSNYNQLVQSFLTSFMTVEFNTYLENFYTLNFLNFHQYNYYNYEFHIQRSKESYEEFIDKFLIHKMNSILLKRY